MNVMRKNTLDAPSSGRFDQLIARHRGALAMLAASLSLNSVACGGGNNDHENPGGSGGVSGSAGEGGTGGVGGNAGEGGMGGVAGEAGVGGSGGEDGTDPCANVPFTGLGSRTYEMGETGAFEVTDAKDSNEAYNGMTFEVKDGAMFLQRSRVVLQSVIYDNYQSGYDKIGDVSGIRPVVIDPDQPYKDDGSGIGNCVLNTLSIDETVLADPSKRPVMRTPQGYYTTVFNVKDNVESMADYVLGEGETAFTVDSLTTDNTESVFVMANAKPNVNGGAYRDGEGHIVVNLAGTTDEGFGDDNVLSRLNASVDGLTFEAIPGEPGKFRSTTPSTLTSLNLTVAGLNEGLTDDSTQVSVDVTETDLCAGKDYDDGNACNGVETCDPATGNKIDGVNVNCNYGVCTEPAGTCDCDTGYDGSDCNTCADGYSGYPNCEVIPPAPVISGLGIDCSWSGGVCYSGALDYPVTFTVANATSCSVTPVLISGSGPAGTNGPVTINGTSASSTHTTGPYALDVIQLRADCNGPGGSATPKTIQFTLDQ